MSETALQPIPPTVPEKFAHQFMGTTPQIVQLLPRDVPLDQFQAGLWMEFTTTPKLKECTPMSLIKAAIKAAMAGHVPGRDCFMLPFKNKTTGQYEATMVEYYQGVVRALDRTGRVEWAKAEPVYARDHFLCDELAERYEFQRHIDGDRGKLRCYFSAVKLKGADKPLVRVSTVEEVDKVRSASPGKDQDPWQKWPEEMGKKTALKKHAKYLQLVPEEEEPISAVNHSALLFGGDEAEQARLRVTRPSVAAILTAPEPEDAGRMPVPDMSGKRQEGPTDLDLTSVKRPPGFEDASATTVSDRQHAEDIQAEYATREYDLRVLRASLAKELGMSTKVFWGKVREGMASTFNPSKMSLESYEIACTHLSEAANTMKADTPWTPEAELLAWLDAEAGRRGVEPVALKSILTEYSEGWEGTLTTLPASQVAPWKEWAAEQFDRDAAWVKEAD